VFIATLYIALIGKIVGDYNCGAYTMLDGGYSESYLQFRDNVITHVYIEPRKKPIYIVIATYTKTGYSTVLVDDINLGFQYRLNIGALGLYMSDGDAARLGFKFPKIGNIWCWRKPW